MQQEREIVNRVAKSTLVTFNLEDYYDRRDRYAFDIKDNLFQEIILKEREFRAFVRAHEWAKYQDKNIALHCSVDAIVPTWAYMLIATALSPYANMVVFGNMADLENALYKEALSKVDPKDYQGAKVVVKGCGELPVPTYAYVEITRLLTPYAASIMYGEPCSTVPLYKKRK